MKKLNDFIKEYEDYIVKDGFMDFLEKPIPKPVWDLKDGDKYFYIDSVGVVSNILWDNNDEYDILRRNQGNVFLTLEEAEYEVKRRDVYATVKRYAYEFSNEEWNDSTIEKYYPYYNYNDYSISKCFNSYTRHSELYFQSKEDIEKAIEAVGEEDFKKYYFGVKE